MDKKEKNGIMACFVAVLIALVGVIAIDCHLILNEVRAVTNGELTVELITNNE